MLLQCGIAPQFTSRMWKTGLPSWREARERVSSVEAVNVVVLDSAYEDAEGLVRMVTLLEGELVEAHRA
jgi:hypothetical protein